MKLHIELDATHPAYEWLEKQADRIGAKGHFGTHIDCYTATPPQGELLLPAYVLDCRQAMPTAEVAAALPSLEGQALILHTGNMYRNDYGSRAYFDQVDTSVPDDALVRILEKRPKLILIDSYGIGQHGPQHMDRDKLCEASDCYVVENIRIAPEEADQIRRIRVNFDLDYPSTGKPCTVVGC